MDINETFGENSGLVLLQLIIIILAIVIIVLIFMDRSNVYKLESKIDDIDCPTCPDCPAAPDCVCDGTECPACPDCNCPTPTGADIPGCPECPECPQCPNVNTHCPTPKTLTIDDITDAIFPGRNKGIIAHGQYFPLDGLGEGMVEPAYSPIINLQPNYVGGDGVPAAISYADQTLLNKNSSIGLAAQKERPMASTQGVFTQNTNKKSDDTNKETNNQSTEDSNNNSSNNNSSNNNSSNNNSSNNNSSNKSMIQNIEETLSNII